METNKEIYPCIKCTQDEFNNQIAPELEKYGWHVNREFCWGENRYKFIQTNLNGKRFVGSLSEKVETSYICYDIDTFLRVCREIAIRKGWCIEEEVSEKKTKQDRIDNRYMAMAYIWAENSYCDRRKVGALIVKDKMIISDGYNGTPSGFPNVCENEEGNTFSYVLHAEANAITKVAKSTNNCEGATLYVTTSPCIECSKLIIQAGIKRVVYCEEYRNTEGIDLLKQAGIKVDQIDKKEIICQVGSIFKK